MVRMAKQPTYHRQRFLVHGGMASESVAQVVDADMAKPCAFAEALKAAVGVAAENWCFVRIADTRHVATMGQLCLRFEVEVPDSLARQAQQCRAP